MAVAPRSFSNIAGSCVYVFCAVPSWLYSMPEYSNLVSEYA